MTVDLGDYNPYPISFVGIYTVRVLLDISFSLLYVGRSERTAVNDNK